MRSTPLVFALVGLTILASCTGTPAPAPAPTAPPPEQPKLDLASLIGSKDAVGIRSFFANRESLDRADSEGLYPLHRAVEQDAADIVELLLVLGAKPDPLDPKGRTPLRLAIEGGKTECARILAERGAALFAKDSAGGTAAEAAVNSGGAILKAVFGGKNINARSEDGATVLHIAADKLAEGAVRDLLALGADPLIKNDRGRSALDLALLHADRIEAARIAELLILRGANPGLVDFAWFSQAVRAVDFASVRFEEGKTPLHEAVERKQRGFVEFILGRGVMVNARNGAGSAPLHEAVRAGWLEGAELLLKNKADPNARDGFDNTPLHIALPEANRGAGVELLLAAGADPSLKDRNGNTPLHVAVLLSYPTSLIQRLLTAGSPVNAANAAGDTPLILSVRTGRNEYISPLLEKGADIFLVNGRGESALSLALAQASAGAPVTTPAGKTAAPANPTATPAPAATPARTETLAALLTPTNVLSRDNQGNTPLHLAVILKSSAEAIAVIVAEGGDLNARSNAGDAPLHLAVRDNLRTQGEALLAAKAEVFAANVKGETPISLGLTAPAGPVDWLFNSTVISARDANGDGLLHHAARRDLYAALPYLGEKGVDVGARNADGKSALAIAVEADAVESVKALLAMGSSLNSRDAMGDTPLHAAVLWGAKRSLPFLLASGIDLEARNYAGETALHQAVRKKDLEALNLLLGKGASVASRENRGATPLALAARSGRPDIVARLLAAGARPDTRDLDGRTSLHGAVDSGDAESAKALVAGGADILALDGSGASPLARAAARSLSLLEILLQPAAINRPDAEGRGPLAILVAGGCAPEVAELLIAKGADPNTRDRYSATALHSALRQGRLDVAAVLVRAGADLFARDRDGESPASLAIARGPDTLKAVAPKERISSGDNLGNGLLHYAALAGNEAAVDWLLSVGADRAARNISGETPSDVAKKRGNIALAAKLR